MSFVINPSSNSSGKPPGATGLGTFVPDMMMGSGGFTTTTAKETAAGKRMFNFSQLQ